LVTGGSGFIGSHIVDKLLEKKYNVKVFDTKKPHRRDVEFIKGDIASLNNLRAAMKNVEYVYHIAALSNINKVVKKPLEAVDLNIISTAKILEASRNSEVKRVIYASSYFVDSGKGHLYTTTKKASEMLCKDYYNLYGLPYTILRYGTAYGPRSRGEDAISIAVKNALSHQPFIIHGDGEQSRNFIYVEDLADGNVRALKNIAKNKTYTLEGIKQIKIKELAEIIKKLTGDLKIKYKDARPEDYTGNVLSIEEATKDLSWKPKIDFEEGIKRYIKWYKEKNKGE